MTSFLFCQNVLSIDKANKGNVTIVKVIKLILHTQIIRRYIMDLSKVERLMITNQFKILEKLYPEDKEYYEIHRKALEEGYKLHYNDAFESLSTDEMTELECREVIDILNMYRALTFSYEKLEVKDDLSKESIKFKGFDGNDPAEIKRLLYTRYFIMDLDRFQELKYDEKHPSFNSHWPALNKYRKMLASWEEINKKHVLTREEIIHIVEFEKK